MKENPYFKKPVASGSAQTILHQVVYPLAVLAVIILVDLYLIPAAVITPMCCIILLGYMALKYRPMPLLIWTVFLTLVSFLVLYLGAQHEDAHITKMLTVIIRTFTLFVGGMVAINLSAHRKYLDENFKQIVSILEMVATPIIISDESGTINYVNEKAAELLGTGLQQVQGRSYFSYIANQSEKGTSIQSYLEIFDGKNTRQEIIVRLRGADERVMKARLMCLGDGVLRRLVTIITETN